MRGRILTLVLALLAIAALAGAPLAAEAAAPSPASAPAKCPTKKSKTKKSRAKRCKKPSRKQATKKKTTKKKAHKKPKRPRPGRPGTPKPAPVTKDDLVPFDYIQNAGLSGASAGEVERVKQVLTVKDGTDIYLEIVKPKGATGLGVILEASPYHGTLYDRTGTRILPQPTGKDGTALGLTGYFPQRGYAVVMMDLRGTGRSRGCLDHLGANDQEDLKEVIEWAATQPWSNGRVGMVGHSYVGSTPQAATAKNPKGLVTIVPSAGLASIYDHQFQDGVPYLLQLAGPIFAYEMLTIDRKLPPGFVDPEGGNTGDDFANNVQDTGCGFANSAITAGPSQYFGQYWAPFHGPRDFARAATAWDGHVFLVHGVNDQAARIAAMHWFNARAGRAGDKLWLGQWDHGIGCCPNQRGIQWTYALQAWFDRQLLQRDIDTGPPVEIFLNDAGTVGDAISKRSEIETMRAFPGAATPTAFGTGSDGSLAQGDGGGTGSLAFVGDPQGMLNPEDTGFVEFATKPFDHDTLLAGVPKLRLSASVTMPRIDLIANVFAINKAGERRRITHCSINPLLRESLDTITPIVPGARMDLNPSCWTMAHMVRTGTKLVLRVAASDPDKVAWAAVDPNVTIYAGTGATALELPVVAQPRLFKDTFPVRAPK